MYTAETLYKACMLDSKLSMGAIVDFGLDINPGLFGVYQEKIREGLSLEELIRASGDGPELSKLIGQKVVTTWDSLGEE